MPLFELDPSADSRWAELVDTHPAASVFHHPRWLNALSETYGYRPIVLTNCRAGEPLTSGIPLCEVSSWITGRRAVSLPFSDHAQPLLAEGEDPAQYFASIREQMRRNRWKYVELRPRQPMSGSDSGLAPDKEYWIHVLDLAPSIDELFRNLHKSSLQRRIKKSSREGLTYERGSSPELLDDFFRLQVMTRKRHQLPPQPKIWFANVLLKLSGSAEIRVARKDGRSVAAIMTLYHKKKAVYKYGCSDHNLHHLAGMPFLFWKLIEECKAAGFTEIDFGRSEMDNEGLVRFKDEFGTRRERLCYLRFPEAEKGKDTVGRLMPIAGPLFSLLPDSVSSYLGRILYRHIG
ncbi:MAG: GNAT family N-acetyltransferase [Terracidiphilus sp.]|jgi:CelD/BcsL family acetyltransferase involved in cellulose biosynthesis